MLNRGYGSSRLCLIASLCSGGFALARAEQRAKRRDDVLDALGRAARDLRLRLGEAPESVALFDTTLRQATTSSLAALKAFSVRNKRALGQDFETISGYRLAFDLSGYLFAIARAIFEYADSPAAFTARTR